MRKVQSVVWLPLLAVIFVILRTIGIPIVDEAMLIVLIVGLFIVGIPHGALDVWTHRARQTGRSDWIYVSMYLACIGLCFFAWHSFPVVGLFVFLLLSAWHFGQADVRLWNQKRGAMLWGTSVLLGILGWHINEMIPIIENMGVVVTEQLWNEQAEVSVKVLSTLGWVGFTARAISIRNWAWVGVLAFLAITPFMPLLHAFGLYFIGQHSFAGWHHLRVRLNQSNWQLWRRASPFSIGAWIIIIIGIWFLDNEKMDADATAGAFFMLLGSISIPHIFESHELLRNGAD